jgi:hypothetical protein
MASFDEINEHLPPLNVEGLVVPVLFRTVDVHIAVDASFGHGSRLPSGLAGLLSHGRRRMDANGARIEAKFGERRPSGAGNSGGERRRNGDFPAGTSVSEARRS